MALTLPDALTEDLLDVTIADADVDTAAELAPLVDLVNTRVNAVAVAVNLLTDALADVDEILSHPMFAEARATQATRSVGHTTHAGTVV